MDVWMSILPMQATEMAHPYIPPRTDAVSRNSEIPMYVYFCPCRPMENAFAPGADLKKPPFSYHPNYIHSKTII